MAGAALRPALVPRWFRGGQEFDRALDSGEQGFPSWQIALVQPQLHGHEHPAGTAGVFGGFKSFKAVHARDDPGASIGVARSKGYRLRQTLRFLIGKGDAVEIVGAAAQDDANGKIDGVEQVLGLIGPLHLSLIHI